MRSRARRFRGPLLLAALLIGAGAPAALAQELQLDPNALDASGATTFSKPKGKKAAVKPQAGQARGAASGQAGKSPDRQFGELEGWSPGKAPPRKKEDEPKSSFGGSGTPAPVSVTPSGNMAVGLPF